MKRLRKNKGLVVLIRVIYKCANIYQIALKEVLVFII